MAELVDALASGTKEYVVAYLNHLSEVVEAHSSKTFTKAKLTFPSGDDVIEAVRISSIVHDLSFLNMLFGQSNEIGISWLAEGGIKKFLRTDSITISLPANTSTECVEAVKAGAIGLAFGYRRDQEAHDLLQKVAPLVRAGRLILEPSRMLFYLRERTEDGRRSWQGFDVPTDSPADLWSVEQVGADKPTEMRVGPPETRQEQLLAELLVPFIDGVSMHDFASILDDEHDLLAEFRASMKAIIVEAARNESVAQEILQDVIQPKLGKIERRFRTITSMNRLKVGGAILGTATLSLVSYFTAGWSASISALGSASGVVYAAKEFATYRSELAALRDDATYLLWRLRGAKHRDR